MAEPVTDAEVDAWMEDAWPNRDTPLWSREQSRAYLEAERKAREKHEARLAAEATRQAKAAEATELPALRAEIALMRGENAALARRVRALERMVGKADPPSSGILMEALGQALAEIRKELEQKIADVAAQQLKFGDVFIAGKVYQPNTFAVSKGSLWISRSETVDPPGSSASWQLVCKQGSFDKPRTP